MVGVTRLSVGLVQVASPADESITARRERVARMVASAPACDLLALPELWAVGFGNFDRYADEAEGAVGPTVAAAREWARERSCHIHAGSFVERTDRGTLRNTAVLIDPAGTVVHRYSKVHVFGYRSREAELLEPGDAMVAADTTMGRVAATTCYDLRFPGLWSELSRTDARTVLVPAAWPAARLEHWRLFTTVRAVEQQVTIIACNAVGDQMAGHSRIVDPWGEVVAEAGTDEGVTVAEIDLDMPGRVREDFRVLDDRLDDYTRLILEYAQEA